MASVNMTLDEIIARTKAQKKGRGTDSAFKSDSVSTGGGGRRRQNNGSGGGRRGGAFSKATPEGRWTHDKFAENDFGAAAAVSGGGGNPLKKVRINLSNLAPTVSSSDLEELFADYGVESALVHYDEAGQSLGTGDVHLRRKEALQAINDFKGIAIDGYKVQLVLVDGGLIAGGAGGIASRIRFSEAPRMVRGGVQKRNGGGGGGGGSNFLRRSGGGGGGGGGRPGGRRGGGGGAGGRDKKPKLTEEELDKELDAYMTKPMSH